MLAIRAAAAAGVNITYKILYNDAVAMTGGQPVEGNPSVGEITREVLASGAKKVVVVSDEPKKYGADAGFAPGTDVRHRDELDAVQRELRQVPGLTVLVYDQTCAAEKRRRRKRGLYPDPPKRVVINEAVCEGCGDCSEQSNCVSVKPLETEFGRKRTIDQSSCNKDFSCLKGFCPSFVTVHGGEPRGMERALSAAEHDPLAHLPPPPVARAHAEPFGMLVTGIGGTGVITVGALVGMAAHLEGKGCTVLDFTGLAQKNGAVMSHVRIAQKPDDLYSVRIAPGGADLVLGCDLVVAASPTALSRIEHGVTRVIANSDLQPTAAFVLNGDVDFEARTMERSLAAAAGSGNVELVDATGLADSAHGRFDRDQPVHARLCVPEGTAAARARVDRARDRTERRRGRGEQAHLQLGPACRARPCDARALPPSVASGRGAGGARARGNRRAARGVPRRISGQGLCAALSRIRGARGGRREGARAAATASSPRRSRAGSSS